MPFFCCATIFMSSPRCHLWLRHDNFDFTEMPSFVAPRYFRICTNSFRVNWGNTVALLRGARQYRRRNATKGWAMYWRRNYAAVPASTSSTALAKIVCHLPHFLPELKNSHCHFHDPAFCSLAFCISPYGRSPTFMFHRDAF
jgi:hypothetical protein